MIRDSISRLAMSIFGERMELGKQHTSAHCMGSVAFFVASLTVPSHLSRFQESLAVK